MDAAGWQPSRTTEESAGSLLSNEDVLASLTRREAVQKDVHQALASLATALASTSNPCVIHTVRHRFDERAEACAKVEKVTEEVKAEKEGRIQSDKARAEAEAALHDEVTRLERAVEAADESREKAQRDAEGAASVSEEEMIRLRQKAESAEKDSETWKQKAKAEESRVESMKAEVGALHEAMAGLHGEMGAVQRELDGAKAGQDKLAADLSRAEGEARKAEEACSATLVRAKDAEKRLRKEVNERERVSAELTKVSELREAEKLALTTETVRLKESEGVYRGNIDKLNATNRDLNTLLQHLSADLQEAKEAAEACAKRADASDLEVGARQEESRRLGEALARTESRIAAAEREKVSLKEALSKASADGHAKAAELERRRAELELLEREKHDLIIDVKERVRALKEATADAERHQERIAEAEKVAEDEKSAKLASEMSCKEALDELGDAKRATAMQDERIEVLRSELTALRRTLEKTLEAAKSRDRENAQRIVELSQATAKLSSEGANTRARAADAEDTMEKIAHDLEDAAKTLAQSKEEGRQAGESVQRLEEELEVADARWKAAQEQLAAADRREKRSAEEARQKLSEALESKNKEVDAALREAEMHAQRRSMEAEASQRAIERNHERTLATVREDAKKRLSEEEARRLREVSEARRKSKAVVDALQALQIELRNSEAKVSGLETQVSQLSVRVGRTSSLKAGGGMASVSSRNSCNGSGSGDEMGSEGGREGNTARGNEVTEAEIASLRRQMKAATQAKEAAEKGALGATSRAEEEAKRRSSLEDALCRKESEMLAALERVDALKLRLQEVEENSQIAEEDLKNLARRRESEIESLARRNEVLSDALSRLTSADTDPEATTAANIPMVYTSSGGSQGAGAERRGTGGNGFPAIPRLMDGRRGVALQLGDSWQSASAPSLSSTTGEGVGTSLTGLEAPLSGLGDSGAGFEPPAPPIVEHHHHHHQHKSHSNGQITERLPDNSKYSGSGVARGSIGLHNGPMEGAGSVSDTWLGGGGRSGNHGADHANSASGRPRDSERGHHNGDRGVADNHTGTSGSSADATRYRPARDRRTALDGGERVLHGVSAAMASGALPTTHPKNTTATTAASRDASRDVGANREVSSGNIDTQHSRLRAQVGDKGGGTQGVRIDEHDGMHRASGGRSGEDGNAGVGEGLGLALEGNIDGREQARRQIDQALRDRALRRRTSDDEAVVRPDRRDSSSLRPRLNKDSTAAAVDLAFPALLRSDFRAGARNSLGGDETRFINLDAMKHRASVGSKHGLPGREGTKVARARSAATGATNGFAIAGAGNNVAARVYGNPQNSR